MLVNEIYIGNMVQGKYGSVSYKTKQNKPRPKSGMAPCRGNTRADYRPRSMEQRVKKRLASDIEVYKKNISEYTKGIRAVYMDKVKGLISENDYAEMSKDFIAERDRLNRAVEDKEKQLAERNEKIKADDNRRELIRQYTNLEHLIDCHPHAGF